MCGAGAQFADFIDEDGKEIGPSNENGVKTLKMKIFYETFNADKILVMEVDGKRFSFESMPDLVAGVIRREDQFFAEEGKGVSARTFKLYDINLVKEFNQLYRQGRSPKG